MQRVPAGLPCTQAWCRNSRREIARAPCQWPGVWEGRIPGEEGPVVEVELHRGEGVGGSGVRGCSWRRLLLLPWCSCWYHDITSQVCPAKPRGDVASASQLLATPNGQLVVQHLLKARSWSLCASGSASAFCAACKGAAVKLLACQLVVESSCGNPTRCPIARTPSVVPNAFSAYCMGVLDAFHLAGNVGIVGKEVQNLGHRALLSSFTARSK